MESSAGCILFVAMEFYPTTPGGAGILLHNTVRLLLERGFTIVYLFDGGQVAFEHLINRDRLGIPFGHRLIIYNLEDFHRDAPSPPEMFPHAGLTKALQLDYAVQKLTLLHDIELIEFYDYCGHGYYYLTRPADDRPFTVVRLHSTIELIERKTRIPMARDRLWLYAMERAQIALADAVLSPGPEYYEKEILPLYPSLTRKRVLISPPVHSSIGQIDYDSNARDVLFYGRLSTLKGLDTFLRGAVLALENSAFSAWIGQFLVVGPEENVANSLSLDELRGIIPEDKVSRFRFLGRIEHTALIDLLHKASFGCFTNRVESFCYAAHELHTAGVPLIVNRIPAFEDGFEDSVSAIFFNGTALGLSVQMRLLARDGKLRLQLSRHGQNRANSYWVDHYTEHLSWLRQQRASAYIPPALSGSVVILTTEDCSLAERTAAGFSSLPLRPFIFELNDAGDLHFAGNRWRGRAEPRDSGIPIDLEMVGEVCLFVRAGDTVYPEWVERALRVLAHDQRIGAVGGWVQHNTGIEVMSYLYIPELAHSAEPGLRVLMRVEKGQTLGEYLHGWSGQSERSYLLSHRAEGRALIELPQLAVDSRSAVELPSVQDIERSVDFDRFSREFLVVSRRLGGTEAGRTSLTDGLVDNDPDIIATTTIPSLIVLRNAKMHRGELWVLRVHRDDHVTELDWSATIVTGSWRKVPEPNVPVGVLMTNNGSMRFHAGNRTGVELLFGPFCGACEVVRGGEIYLINLRAPEISSKVIWFDALDKLNEKRQTTERSQLTVRMPLKLPIVRPEHAILQVSQETLIVIGSVISSEIVAVLRGHGVCCILSPEELGLLSSSGPKEGISYSREVIRAVGNRQIAIDTAVPGALELAEYLLEDEPSTNVIALFGEKAPLGASGAVEAYRKLGPWLRLARQFSPRFTAASASAALSDFFSRCKIATIYVLLPLPILGTTEHQGQNTVEVVVLPGLASVTSTAHMICAIGDASRNGLGVSRLWIPAGDRSSDQIARRFAATVNLKHYDKLETAFNEPARRICLAIFPDDNAMPDGVDIVLSRGALPILGPGSIFSTDQEFRDTLCVSYWEDAMAISTALARTAKDFDRLVNAYERFRLHQEQAIKVALVPLFGPHC